MDRQKPLQQTDPVAALRPLPSKLFVETTTHCNLACPMCVKHAEGSTIVEGEMTAQTYSALEPAFPGLDALILNGIGEPLLHPQLVKFVEQARRQMPRDSWIGFQSNGLLFDDQRAMALAQAGVNRVCLSIDSLNPALFSKIRQGGKLGAVQRAFSSLNKAKKITAGQTLKIGMELVAVQENIHELPELIRWAAGQGVDFALVTQMLPYDQRFSEQIAYDVNTDAAIEIFDRWQRIALANNIDISTYMDTAWNRQKPKDMRIMILVEAMKSEARKKGIFFNLADLLTRSPEGQQQIAEQFERATAVANEVGMELKLPTLVAKQQRHCAFVEDGGAFITWQGDLHPCYNLWHNYRCYINGWENRVTTRNFGNVNQQDLAQIWNQPEFRRFRENVLQYDYPFCSSCSVAPCDYIDNDRFEQDCYLRSEPCGTCLWSMGLLQCLQ
ncbi:MAG: radical SAM/SPASM family putative metalloenzyme maturase [Desulfuromonas sp.]|nr:radical SAM/SPASM family putative metalloenzyme maturase [Desulfuromonas sp.]